MKKFLAVLMAVAMMVAVSASSAMVAFADDNVGSIETTTKRVISTGEVNGQTSQDVTYETDPDDPNKITFTYTGDGTLIGWEFPGLVEGVQYEILSEEGNSITVLVINGYDGEVIANAIVEYDEDEPTTKKPHKNESGKSPNTGAVSAVGLGVAAAGVAILAAMKKKDHAE